ncbi:ROK family glucokinase [Thermoactinomyces mirandus]|uniref:ROK family glucokinase n=1 Tax=Thermoactinomyces mirandus TaxID=2756294 RepID=UPI0028A92668|nr:ROK family glucokinase [Thermoactinomyces mirandus]
MKRFFIGIDLGGTSMKIGLVSDQGKVIRETEKPTLKEEGADGVIDRMVSHARNLAKEACVPWQEIQGVGVGLPGFLDIPGGVVKYMTNLGWTDIPIRDRLQSAWQVPVKIDNDANVAALGEVWSGAGNGEKNAICITLGTGVGGGIIAEGELLHGAKGFAGEIGHIQVEPEGALCNCGQTGCLETVSSATGMVRLVHHAVSVGEKTCLAPYVRDGSLSTRHIFAEAKRGDAVARKTVDQAVHALAQVMATLSVVLNPSLFIIGGGVSQAGESLLNPLRKKYQCLAQKNARQDVRIVLAQLGNRAGFIGAAGLLAHIQK